MLGYVVERLRRCRELGGVVVATSTVYADDAIDDACRRLGVDCHRCPLDDVLGRFLEVIEARALPAVVRISGDSPLIDAAIVDRAVKLFQENAVDLVTNVAPRSFPRGQSVEVISAAALRCADAAGPSAEEREHVTLWLYRHPERCRTVNFTAPTDLSKVQMSVDTAEDFARFAATVAAMDRPHWAYGFEDILALQQSIASGAEAARS